MGAPERLVCTHCLLPFGGTYGHNFVGLRKWLCPRCRYENEWPMTRTREVVYWCLAGLMLLAMIAIMMSGAIPTPGILFVLIIVGLVMNHFAKRSLRFALERMDVSVLDGSGPPAFVPMVAPPAAGGPAPELLCLKCLLPFGGAWQTSFLGMRKWACPRCRYTNEWPATTAREVGYCIAGGFALLWSVPMVQAGIPPIPGVLTIAVGVLLALNHGAKKRLREAQRRFQQAAAAARASAAAGG